MGKKTILGLTLLLTFLSCIRDKTPITPIPKISIDREVSWILSDSGWVTQDTTNFQEAKFIEIGYTLISAVEDTSILLLVAKHSYGGTSPILYLQFFPGRVIPHIFNKQLYCVDEIYIPQWGSIPIGSEVFLHFVEYRTVSE